MPAAGFDTPAQFQATEPRQVRIGDHHIRIHFGQAWYTLLRQMRM